MPILYPKRNALSRRRKNVLFILACLTLTLPVEMIDFTRELEFKNEKEAVFSSTISYLQELGHKVVLLGDIPRYSISSEACKFGKFIEQSTPLCSMSVSQFKSQLEVYEPTLQELSSEYQIPFISIHQPLCSTESCSMIGDKEILYRDNNHLNIPGSRLIGKYLSSKLGEFR